MFYRTPPPDYLQLHRHVTTFDILRFYGLVFKLFINASLLFTPQCHPEQSEGYSPTHLHHFKILRAINALRKTKWGHICTVTRRIDSCNFVKHIIDILFTVVI